MSSSKQELRYGFGKNWAEYVEINFNQAVIDQSQTHLAKFLRLESLKALTFIDIGCGSGLHSLPGAWARTGSRVSIMTVRIRFRPQNEFGVNVNCPKNWTIAQGSVLDRNFMEELPTADIVYSWGVLHHTGDMWNAVRNAVIPMKENGVFFI